VDLPVAVTRVVRQWGCLTENGLEFGVIEMGNLTAKVRNFLRDEEGGETVEWVFVVALLVVGLAGAWLVLRNEIVDTINAIANQLINAQDGP
jgi:Flp pilus assembly pilin Flp